MTEYSLMHLLLVSMEMVMDTHLARWRMEDLLLTVITLASMKMGVNNMYTHWKRRLMSLDGSTIQDRLTKRGDKMD